MDARGSGTPYNGRGGSPPKPLLSAQGDQVRPIMGGKPPQTPHNTIPPRTAIFITQSPRFARGLDKPFAYQNLPQKMSQKVTSGGTPGVTNEATFSTHFLVILVNLGVIMTSHYCVQQVPTCA